MLPALVLILAENKAGGPPQYSLLQTQLKPAPGDHANNNEKSKSSHVPERQSHIKADSVFYRSGMILIR